jgi:hypothetical protein
VYTTFTLHVSKGSDPGTPNYKKSIRTFEEGDPQQWMDVITGLREIWAQNLITAPKDMSNTVVGLLKGDCLTAYEAAMEDRLMKMRTLKQAKRKKPSSSQLTKRRTMIVTLIDS